ncbi:hypothetical protein ARSEF1564_007161 [Beauveria bassiana]
MRRIGRTKHLSCFYCGKQTGLKYDGTITDFLCLSCDATNYLDQNGDITDPPVATEREAAPPSQYARPQPAASIEPDAVFCSTCLKNQRLFTASLAQYLPDDPSHPDYAELDGNYYRYRRNLERRYPQVCEACAGTVQDRIRQAGYTAKTDHLRRMMDKSRGRTAAAATTRRAGILDAVGVLGAWLWRAGLAAQLLWHLQHIVRALERQDNGMYDPDDSGVVVKGLAATRLALAWLPDGDALMRASIAAAILSVWWNPHFVQFSRGFTRHLLGFTRWYSFQGLIVFFRILFRSVLSMQGGAAQSQSAQLSVHLATAGIMCFIYSIASRSIKVDTTPLFRPDDKPLTPRHSMTPIKRREQDAKTFSELFNEALDSTPQKGGGGGGGVSSLTATPGTPGSSFVPPSQLKMMQRGFNSTPLQPSSAAHADSGDEMDWSPSQPPHRAFRTDTSTTTTTTTAQNKDALRPFGQSPTHDNSGSSNNQRPFWFKVPPAPTNPARQLRNPPNAPVLRKKPVKQDGVFFSSSRDSAKFRNRNSAAGDNDKDEAQASMTFRNPRFFAPEKPNDEANSLADLLSESFSLGNEQQGSGEGASHPLTASFSSSSSFSPFSKRHHSENNNNGNGNQQQRQQQQRRRRRPPHQIQQQQSLALMTLCALLPLWLLVSYFFFSMPCRTPLQGLVLVVAGVVALSSTHDGDAQPRQEQQRQRHPMLLDAGLSALGVVELAAVCWLGWETWTAGRDVQGSDAYGAGILAMMLGHRAARRLLQGRE